MGGITDKNTYKYNFEKDCVKNGRTGVIRRRN